MNTIIVTGVRIRSGGGGGGSGGGGGGGDPPRYNYDAPIDGDSGDQGGSGGSTVAQQTWCVDEAPSGVDLQDLNKAKEVAETLASLSASSGNEWGALIYRMRDGSLRSSAPFSSNHEGDLNSVEVEVPDGAIIVGYVHTRPESDDLDQRLPLPGDRQFMEALRQNPLGSPRALLYVNTSDNSSSNKTWVYDVSRTNSNQPSCTL